MDRKKYLEVAKKALALAYPTDATQNLGANGMPMPPAVRFGTIQLCIAAMLKAENYDAADILQEVNKEMGTNDYTDSVLFCLEHMPDPLAAINKYRGDSDAGF